MNAKRIILGTAAIGITLGSMINFQQPAEAGIFKDLERKVRKAGRRINPIDPNSYVGRDLHAKFKICNRTNTTVYYSLLARSDSLRPGRCVKWTTKGQAVISFDRSFLRGYQRKTYSLNDGNYSFRNVRWQRIGRGIDLKRN